MKSRQDQKTILLVENEVREQLRKKSDLLRFYRLCLDGMDDCKIAVLDREYRYKVVSRQYMISYDLPEEEILGKTVAELMGEDVFAEFLKPKIDSCLEGNHIQYSEWFDFPATGKRYMEVSYYPLSFEDQEVNAVAAVVKDITERKKAEEKLTGLYDETSRMNRLMSGREDRIIELKKEVNKLSRQLNQGIVYKCVDDEI